MNIQVLDNYDEDDELETVKDQVLNNKRRKTRGSGGLYEFVKTFPDDKSALNSLNGEWTYAYTRKGVKGVSVFYKCILASKCKAKCKFFYHPTKNTIRVSATQDHNHSIRNKPGFTMEQEDEIIDLYKVSNLVSNEVNEQNKINIILR